MGTTREARSDLISGRARPNPGDPADRRLPLGMRARPWAVLLAVAAALALLGLRMLVAPAIAAPGPAQQPSPEVQVVEKGDAVATVANQMPSVPQEEAGPVGEGFMPDDPREEPPTLELSRGTTSSRGGSRAPDPAPIPLTEPAPEPKQSTGGRIAAVSREYLGYRYAWGGTSPRTGFDCSGFVWFVYREAGVNIPRSDLRAQLNAGPRIERDDLLPGDLVFFQNTYVWGLSHVGIYLGDGQFIHAETWGTGVRITSLSERFWGAAYLGASRPW